MLEWAQTGADRHLGGSAGAEQCGAGTDTPGAGRRLRTVPLHRSKRVAKANAGVAGGAKVGYGDSLGEGWMN